MSSGCDQVGGGIDEQQQKHNVDNDAGYQYYADY
jgi:hypothetical protein